MKSHTLTLLLFTFLPAHAQTLLWADNFDAPDNASFDAAPLTARLTGTLAAETYLRSYGIQHQIANGQYRVSVVDGVRGGLRFEDASNDPATTGPTDQFDWAAGATGAAILAANGFTVNFDWTPTNNTATQWVAWNVGHPNSTPGFRVNQATTDYGVLFRNNGGTQRFDNSAGLGDGLSFTTTAGGAASYAVEIHYSFSSFADGTNVTAVASVDGTQIASDVFQWFENGGSLYMDFQSVLDGQLIDNLAISTLNAEIYSFALSETIFSSGAVQGDEVGMLDGVLNGTSQASTFTFVAGEGDDDNAKFQITDDRLEVGNFNFNDPTILEGETYTIRVRAENDGGAQSDERAVRLRLLKDADTDRLLDAWELRWADDLTTLSGELGTEDLDADGLSDRQEYLLSVGQLPERGTFPDIDPTEGDVDEDTLTDFQEIFPTAPRAVTNPALADSDRDGLSDLVETNSGTFVSMTDTGTDPASCDTDGDFANDAHELANGGNPFLATDFLATVSDRVTITTVTDLASSTIADTEEYTHAVSGGGATTINSVPFAALTPTNQPANLAWEAGDQSLNGNAPINNGAWDPALANVTDEGLLTLFGSFTFSSNGAAPSSQQSFTLSGLTIGRTYELALFIRPWTRGGSGRPSDLTFVNGSESVTPFGSLPADRTNLLTGSDNRDEALRVAFNYTAQAESLVINALVPACGSATSGSFHMYGLTNQVSGPPIMPTITIARFLADGRYALGFQAAPSTTYRIAKSTDLVTFTPLNVANPTTDAFGSGQVVIPTLDVSDPKAFFRIESVE